MTTHCEFTVVGVGKRKCRRCGFVARTDTEPEKIHRDCTPSRGLGDTIAKMTKAVGIKPCRGCKGRIKKLNEWFPYKGKE